MIKISRQVAIPDNEIEISAVRAQGAGGQNVNKVSSAIHLRFNIPDSSLPEAYKRRLLAMRDRRITAEGIVIIKAQQYRSQEKNREAALLRLQELIRGAMVQSKQRVPTGPTPGSRRRRLEQKSHRAKIKTLRQKVIE